MKSKRLFTIALFILISLCLYACGSNLRSVSKIDKVPITKTIHSPYNKVWSATMAALIEEENLKMSDKDGGIIVTDFKTVDGKELNLWKIYWGGKTFKYSYNIYIKPIDKNNTDVKTTVKLRYDQWALLSREGHEKGVENYLRKKLIDKILKNL